MYTPMGQPQAQENAMRRPTTPCVTQNAAMLARASRLPLVEADAKQRPFRHHIAVVYCKGIDKVRGQPLRPRDPSRGDGLSVDWRARTGSHVGLNANARSNTQVPLRAALIELQ